MQKTAHARANSVLRKAGVDRVPKWTATDSESEAECVEPEVARVVAVARVLTLCYGSYHTWTY